MHTRQRLLWVIFSLFFISLTANSASAMLNPTLGRFMQEDPILRSVVSSGAAGCESISRKGKIECTKLNALRQYADGMNLYSPYRNNPETRIDWDGFKSTVYLECTSIQQKGLGYVGAKHCSVVVCCDQTKTCTRLELTGGNDASGHAAKDEKNLPYPLPPASKWGWDRFTVDSPGLRHPEDIVGDSCCGVANALINNFRKSIPPPYGALGDNSNRFAHWLLNSGSFDAGDPYPWYPTGAVG